MIILSEDYRDQIIEIDTRYSIDLNTLIYNIKFVFEDLFNCP